MKIKQIFTTTLILAAIGLSAQSFVKVGGQATDIAISPKDGSVYVVNASKNIKKYNSKSNKFLPFGKQSKNAKSVAVHSNGSVYITSTSNEVFIDVNGRWNKIPGIKTEEVDVDKNGNVRALDLSGKLKKLFQGQWKDQNLVNKNTSGFNQIIGKDSKVLFARFKDNKFHEFKSGKWKVLNGSPLKITMDDKTGTVYAVGRNKGIYKWNSGTNKWILLKNTRRDFSDVAVHDGKIWAIATDKSIYYYKESNTASTNLNGTYKVSILNIISSKENEIYGTMGVYLNTTSNNVNVDIKPLDNKPNRYWDFSSSNAQPTQHWNTTISNYVNNSGTNDTWNGRINVDKIREFTLTGDMGNPNAVLDFQFNIKKKMIGKDWGEWERFKLKLNEISFGKEYVYFHRSSTSAIVFKIEKK